MIRFAREGAPFIAAGVALTAGLGALAWLRGGWWTSAAGVAAVLTLFVLYFFRDPVREGPSDPALVLAPGEGRVVEITEVDEPTLFGGPARRISIFLSIFDVHVQRSPVDGRVVHRSYRPGGYAIAWKPKASEENEQASLGLETPAGPVLVRQIAGLVARRIVTDPEEGDEVRRGERIGLIRFGSRVDTFVPLEWEVACDVGDRARVGRTALARMPGPAPAGDDAGPGGRPSRGGEDR